MYDELAVAGTVFTFPAGHRQFVARAHLISQGCGGYYGTVNVLDTSTGLHQHLSVDSTVEGTVKILGRFEPEDEAEYMDDEEN